MALNGSWAENYGKNATRNGPDIPLVVSQPTRVKFYYDHKTHWITENFNKPVIVAMGDFQAQLGCAQNNDAGCLRSWLQDPDGDDLFTFATRSLKAGTYSVTLTRNENPQDAISETRQFTVKADGDEIYFGYDNVKKSSSSAPKARRAAASPSKKRTGCAAIPCCGTQWVRPDTSTPLFYSPEAALELTATGLEGGIEIPLTYSPTGADAAIRKRFPHLASLHRSQTGRSGFRQDSRSPQERDCRHRAR